MSNHQYMGFLSKFQTKDYKIGICCFSNKHPQGVSAKTTLLGIRIMYLERVYFQRASTIKIQLNRLVYYKVDIIIILIKKYIVLTMIKLKNCSHSHCILTEYVLFGLSLCGYLSKQYDFVLIAYLK